MKMWKEYCENVKDYYEFVKNDSLKLDDMVVFSYNVSGINYNREKFWDYCKNELLYDLLMPDSMYIYLIATEKIKNYNSKIEHYKKCWKKIEDSFDIQGFELGLEIEHEYNGNYYYSGIAKTNLYNIEKLLKILDFKRNKYITIMSKQDYFDDIDDIRKKILDYVSFDKYENVDYSNSFWLCKKNQDIVCRYGVDSISAEFSLIMSKTDMNNYISNRFFAELAGEFKER